MYNVILFDLDGTLTDSETAIINAFRFALLEQFSIEENDIEKLKKVFQSNFIESFMIRGNCTKDEAMKAVGKYREYYGKNGTFETRVYEGIPELLFNLKKEGKTIILATSKPTPIAEKVLEHFELKKYFDFISGSNIDGTKTNKCEVIQYAIDKCMLKDLSSMVMVGDTEYDIIGAKKIGIDSIGVGYGIGKVEELRDASYIVHSVSELEDLLYSLECLNNYKTKV